MAKLVFFVNLAAAVLWGANLFIGAEVDSSLAAFFLAAIHTAICVDVSRDF